MKTGSLISLLAAACLLPVLAIWYGSLTLDFPLNYGEGPLIDQALRLSRFSSIYETLTNTPPFVISNYPPLFTLLQVPFFWIFGPSFIPGRAISLAASLVCAAIIYKIAIKLGSARQHSALAAIIFLTISPLNTWYVLNRVDSLALMFGLLSCYLALDERITTKRLFLIGTTTVLAAFAKQTSFAMPAIFVFLLLWRRFSFSFAAFYLLAVTFVVVTFGFAINAITDDGFLFHTVFANTNSLEPHRLVRTLKLIVFNCPILLLAPLALALQRYFVFGVRSNDTQLIIIFGLLASLPNFTAVIKVGSSFNYLFEIAAWSAIAVSMLATNIKGSSLRAAMWSSPNFV